jgi:short-subunit dehydrogenase
LSDSFPWHVAWITGASGAICGELARRLASAGVKVAATARPSPKLQALAASTPNITAFPADVLEPGDLMASVAAIEQALGPIDLLIAGAGMYEPFEVGAIDLRGFRETIELNVNGVMNTVAAVLPSMLQRKSGQIALMGSLFGYAGWPGNGAYGASKAAVINLAESLKLELTGRGVAVTLINPGFVDTPLNAGYEGKKHFVMTPQRCARRILKRLPAKPYEIAFPVQVNAFLRLARAAPNRLRFAMIRSFIKLMG